LSPGEAQKIPCPEQKYSEPEVDLFRCGKEKGKRHRREPLTGSSLSADLLSGENNAGGEVTMFNEHNRERSQPPEKENSPAQKDVTQKRNQSERDFVEFSC